MNRWIVAAGVSAIVGIALAACGDSEDGTSFGEGGPCPGRTPPAAPVDEETTVEELTSLVAEAITCPGYAFHMWLAGDTESGPYSSYSESETWVDMANNLARTKQLSRLTSDEALAEAESAEAEGEEYNLEYRSTWIVRSDGSYAGPQDGEPADKGRPPSCYGPGREVLGMLIPCYDGPLQEIETSVEVSAAYNGKAAIAYVATGTSSGSDETYDTISRTFFDIETLLPIGSTREGTLDIGEIYPVNADLPYETEFVALDSLPADFFDPASIGYVEPDPYDVEAPLDEAEVPVYWLGRDFAGGAEFPAATLDRVLVRHQAQSGEGGFVVEMTYRPADDEFGHALIRIDLLTPQAWEFREQRTMRGPCGETVQLDFDDLDATMEIGHWGQSQAANDECLPPDRHSAVVHFDDVVVDIDAPATSGLEAFYSPYDTPEGIELLVRSLELRE